MKKLLKLQNIQKRYFDINFSNQEPSLEQFENDNKDLIKIAFSSREPYPRNFGMEVLEVIGHEEGDMDLTRLNNNAALLFNHNWDEIIGVVKKAFIEDGVGYAYIQLSATAEKYKTLVSEGILSKVSFGYEITAMERIGEQEGIPLVKVKTTPYEISLVSIPADDTVGVVAKGLQTKEVEFEIEEDEEEEQEECETKEKTEEEENGNTTSVDSNNDNNPQLSLSEEQGSDNKEEKELQIFDNGIKIKENINTTTISLNNGEKKMKEILELGKKYGQQDLAIDFVNMGKSLEQFQEALIEKKFSEASTVDAGTQKEMDQFNLGAYLKEAAEGKNGKHTGLAKEMSKDFESRGYATHGVNSIIIPRALMNPVRAVRGAGDYNFGVPTGGGNWAYPDNRTQLIDYLYHASVWANLTTVMPSAEGYGSVTYPIVTGKNSTEMLGENKAATKSRQDTANVTFAPKTAKATAKYTRELLKTFSVESLQAFAVHGLQKAMIEKRNQQLLNGSGTNGEVMGIFNASGTNVISTGADGAAITYSKVVEFESAVSAADVNLTRCGYVTNSKVIGAMKSTQKFSSFGAPILEGNMANGYECYLTNEVKNDYTKGTGTKLSGMAFINSEFVYVTEWGGLELMVNPYIEGDGAVRVEAFDTFDAQITRAIALSVCKDILA